MLHNLGHHILCLELWVSQFSGSTNQPLVAKEMGKGAYMAQIGRGCHAMDCQQLTSLGTVLFDKSGGGYIEPASSEVHTKMEVW